MYKFCGELVGRGCPQFTMQHPFVEIDRLAEFAGDTFLNALLRSPDGHVVEGVANQALAEGKFVVEGLKVPFAWHD